MSRAIAFISTPVKVSDLVAMLSGMSAGDMTLTVNEDGVLELRA